MTPQHRLPPNDGYSPSTPGTAQSLPESVRAHLTAHVAALPHVDLSTEQARQILALLDRAHSGPTADEPEFCLVAAEASFRCNLLDDALQQFETARLGFAPRGQHGLHGLCLLRMAQIHHRREDNDTAAFYTDRAAALLGDHPDIDPHFLGELYCGLARLAPDIGRLGACHDYAEQALRHFETSGDAEGQFDALMLQALAAQQTGDLRRAGMLLGVAQQLIAAAGLDVHAQLFVANTRAHVAWYGGDLAGAQQAAADAIALADDQAPQSKQRVYNRLVMANVLRDQGEIDTARQAYAEVADLTHTLDFARFLPWVDVNRAWLEILQGELPVARRRLLGLLAGADRTQRASFQVFLAVVYALTKRHAEAQALFEESLAFYAQGGDPMSCCALHMHLAHVARRTGRQRPMLDHLGAALAWLEEHHLTYFPIWWHPPIVADLCSVAVEHELHPVTAERMLVRHLPVAGAQALMPLLSHGDAAVRQRAQGMLRLLHADPEHILAHTTNDAAKEVIRTLLAEGFFNPARFDALAAKLTTANKTGTPNPVLIAVLGLYLQGGSRREIAQRLGVSEATVRNYLGVVYGVFGIGIDGFDSTGARMQVLWNQCVDLGFVAATPA